MNTHAAQVRDAWDAIADGFDRHITPHTIAFGEEVLDRLSLGPGVRVLDIGAGSGGLAIPAARTSADVVAVDIAPTMIERLTARAGAEGLTNLDARVGDGTALDLDDDSFDVTLSLNGVSLFPDLAGGLREAVRVTRPGGTVLIVTFGPLPEVEFVAFFLGALRATAPEAVPPPTQPMPPFRLADSTTLQQALKDAGLSDVSVESMTWDMTFDSVDHFLDVLIASNPIAGQVTTALSDEQSDEFRHVLDGMLKERRAGTAGALLRATMRIGLGTV
ncbi:MAG: methyltransferase domain-containing protein [Actinomycetota bacterium]|nr:methyltransferase domain-containing protein [Actinomycetota bacterium]